MMRHALFSRSRSCSRLRSIPQPLPPPKIRSFFQSARQLHLYQYEEDLEPWEQKIAFKVEQVVESVRTQAITPQNAVQRITSLAKDKPEDELATICTSLWDKSFEAVRISSGSTSTIADFLIQLSNQSQEDYNEGSKGSAPIMVEDEYGNKGRLWHDMPHIWSRLSEVHTTIHETRGAPDRKTDIDRLLIDRKLISTLFLSTSPVFKQLWDELLMPFYMAATWPPLATYHREDWEVWIPMIVVQMNTAGAELKDFVLGGRSHDDGWFNLGWWLRWQKRLLAMAVDETIEAELRATAKEAHDMMSIERHHIYDWWRRWQHVLVGIANGDGDKDERITAMWLNNMLTREHAKGRTVFVSTL